MILGILTALGATKLSAIALGIVLTYLCILVLLRRRQRVSIPTPLWLLTGCIALSAIWSANPGKPLWICTHIITAYLAYQVLPRKGARWGISLIAAIQIGAILWQYTTTDVSRPAALARNASVLGLAGMWMLPLYPSAILSGLSISRTALLGAGLLALTGKRYIIPFVVLASVFLTTTLLTNPSRLSLETLSRNWNVRVDALHGVTSETNPSPDPVVPTEIEWRWYGYGWGQYYLATGQIQPHNIFVRTWYELGLFTIPVGYCLVILWLSRTPAGGRFRDHDWRFLLVACATGMLTDELLGSVEGVYMVLGYAIINAPAHRFIRAGRDAPLSATM